MREFKDCGGRANKKEQVSFDLQGRLSTRFSALRSLSDCVFGGKHKELLIDGAIPLIAIKLR
jgi:hypothetical protein